MTHFPSFSVAYINHSALQLALWSFRPFCCSLSPALFRNSVMSSPPLCSLYCSLHLRMSATLLNLLYTTCMNISIMYSFNSFFWKVYNTLRWNKTISSFRSWFGKSRYSKRTMDCWNLWHTYAEVKYRRIFWKLFIFIYSSLCVLYEVPMHRQWRIGLSHRFV